MIFTALLLFDTDYPVDVAVSLLMCLVGVFNLVVMCIAPGFDSAAMPIKFGEKSSRSKKGSDKSDSQTDEDLDSDMNQEDHDNLLPQTYAGVGHRENMSNAPATSYQ